MVSGSGVLFAVWSAAMRQATSPAGQVYIAAVQIRTALVSSIHIVRPNMHRGRFIVRSFRHLQSFGHPPHQEASKSQSVRPGSVERIKP
jgi:hypothetical protein